MVALQYLYLNNCQEITYFLRVNPQKVKIPVTRKEF